MNWYYVQAGQQAGPVNETEFQQLVANGKISGTTLIWREGMANWQPYGEVKPATQSSSTNLPFGSTVAPVVASMSSAGVGAPPVNEVVCAECMQIFPRDQAIQYGNAWVCAICKPTFVQKLKEGATIPGVVTAMVYAGFWIRAVAFILDILIMGAVQTFLQFILGFLIKDTNQEAVIAFTGVFMVLSMGLQAVYEVWFLVKYGATPGKMALRLKVVTSQGGPISWGRALGRYFARMLSGCTLCIGYIIAAFDEEKRTLHDHICDTRVIKT